MSDTTYLSDFDECCALSEFWIQKWNSVFTMLIGHCVSHELHSNVIRLFFIFIGCRSPLLQCCPQKGWYWSVQASWWAERRRGELLSTFRLGTQRVVLSSIILLNGVLWIDASHSMSVRSHMWRSEIGSSLIWIHRFIRIHRKINNWYYE